MSDSRDIILELIKAALSNKNATEPEINYTGATGGFFVREPGSHVELFERSFTRLQGVFFSCNNINGVGDLLIQFPSSLLHDQWCCTVPGLIPVLQQAGISLVNDVLQAEVAVTGCECLVARTGSVILSAAQLSGRALPVYAPVHIVIANVSQLLYDTGNAISFLQKKYRGNLPSSLHFIAGPSRTGDIEKTLVMGVHGPKVVFVFLLDG
ncbi:MAG: LUD domain-containing protein [Chitinophagaceae bacterium]|nr:LUD domain-containing protein [Chitinophagaceae bacterium]MCW5926049.1 LUD domain-containing protein [Chitinophagaceae bacterium]